MRILPVFEYSIIDARVLCSKAVHSLATGDSDRVYRDVHIVLRVCKAVPTAPGTISASSGASSLITPVVRKRRVGRIETEPAKKKKVKIIQRKATD